MNWLKMIGEIIYAPISWLVITYNGLCDWFGVPEWLPISIAIIAIGLIVWGNSRRI